LYEREFRSVFRAVWLLSGDPTLAEDATQEAFARALARWRRIAAHPSPAGWVTTTALNVARRSKRTRAVPPDPGSSERDLDAGIDLRSAIRGLPPRQQEAVVLHHLLDLSVAETASSMGVDPGTVKTHLARARAALASALDAEEPRSDVSGDPHE
jgi:RNA polymerase sigma-70 factor (ECF subfamily)